MENIDISVVLKCQSYQQQKGKGDKSSNMENVRRQQAGQSG